MNFKIYGIVFIIIAIICKIYLVQSNKLAVLKSQVETSKTQLDTLKQSIEEANKQQLEIGNRLTELKKTQNISATKLKNKMENLKDKPVDIQKDTTDKTYVNILDCIESISISKECMDE